MVVVVLHDPHRQHVERERKKKIMLYIQEENKNSKIQNTIKQQLQVDEVVRLLYRQGINLQ